MTKAPQYRHWAKQFVGLLATLTPENHGDLKALFTDNVIFRDILLLGNKPITYRGVDAITSFFAHEDTKAAFKARLSGVTLGSVDIEAEHENARVWIGVESEVVKATLTVLFPPDQDSHLKASRITLILDEWNMWKAPHAISKGNTTDAREAAQNAEVLIIGAGQAGLQTAHRLQSMGFTVAVVEKTHRVGDIWRHKYTGLSLHLPKHFMTFLDYVYSVNAAEYLSPEELADDMERYVADKDIAVLTSTTVKPGATFENGAWNIHLLSKHGDIAVHPKFLVWSTGVSGQPKIPEIPGSARLRILHTHHFQNPSEFEGKRVLVVGTGNSGMDCAKVLVQAGAKPTILQRSPSVVQSIEFNTQCIRRIYPREDYDSIVHVDRHHFAIPWSDVRAIQEGILIPMQYNEVDKEMLEGIRAKGFRTKPGAGVLQYHERFGGYYFNTGCAEEIIAGRIPILSGSIERIEGNKIFTTGGKEVEMDAVLLATGYHSINETIEGYVPAVRGKLDPFGGTDASGELSVGYVQTAVPRLYIAAADFSAARHYSKYLGLTLQGIKLGMVPDDISSA